MCKKYKNTRGKYLTEAFPVNQFYKRRENKVFELIKKISKSKILILANFLFSTKQFVNNLHRIKREMSLFIVIFPPPSPSLHIHAHPSSSRSHCSCE